MVTCSKNWFLEMDGDLALETLAELLAPTFHR